MLDVTIVTGSNQGTRRGLASILFLFEVGIEFDRAADLARCVDYSRSPLSTIRPLGRNPQQATARPIFAHPPITFNQSNTMRVASATCLIYSSIATATTTMPTMLSAINAARPTMQPRTYTTIISHSCPSLCSFRGRGTEAVAFFTVNESVTTRRPVPRRISCVEFVGDGCFCGRLA